MKLVTVHFYLQSLNDTDTKYTQHKTTLDHIQHIQFVKYTTDFG